MRNYWISSVGRILTKMMEREYPNSTYAISAAVRAWPYRADKLIAPQYNGSKASLIPEYVLQKTPTAPVHQHPYYHEILKNCAPYWQNDIEYWKPKVIVVMGNVAKEAIFPNERRSILELADETLYYNNIPVRFVTSSHFILYKPSLKETWIQNFKRTLEGKKKAFWDYKLIDINKKAELFPDGVIPKDTGFWELLTTPERTTEVLRRLMAEKKPVSIDTETQNLNKRYGAVLGMIQVSNDPKMIYAIPWIHYETPFDVNDMDQLIPVIREFLESSDIPIWYTWNGKFEKNILENTFQASMQSRIFDGVVGEFLLDENRLDRASEYKYGIYTLKQISLDRLGYDGWDQDVLKFRGDGSLMDLPLLKIAEYGCTDVGLTQLCCEHQIAEAERVEYTNFIPLIYGLIDPIIRVFSQVERDGFPASRDYVRTMVAKSSPLIGVIKETLAWVQNTPEGQRANKILLERTTRIGGSNITPLARTPVVFDFAKQGHAQVLFFDVMGLEPVEVSENGTKSVDGEFQEAYKTNPIVAKFSEWVEAKKMFDSFVKPLYDYLDPSGPHMDSKTDQRIRPGYKISGVVTGRIACSEPNLQAIPRADSDVKKWIKNIFQVTKKGRILVQLDYKANEMRWVGIAAKDMAMAKKFNSGKEALDRYRTTLDPEDFKLATLYGDVHKQNAASAFKIPITEVSKNQRQAAKGISFGVLYDSSEQSVAELYKLDLQETKDMFAGFYQEHHWIYGWKMEMKEMARQKGYVEAPHGRRRRFPIFDLYRNEQGWYDDNLVPREHRSMIADALRQSSNAPIQGIASDAANIGASNLLRYIKRNKKDWLLCNVVHDSCIVDIPFADMDEYIEVAEPLFTTDVMDYMNGLWDIDFILPLEIDFDMGIKWGELIGWDFSPTGLTTIRNTLTDLVL
jgi:DNA polymerase I-like protein with 3'-5' exonuclease and polymerase domains